MMEVGGCGDVSDYYASSVGGSDLEYILCDPLCDPRPGFPSSRDRKLKRNTFRAR